MAELTIPVRDIDDVGKDFTFTLSPAWMERELADCQLRPAASGSIELHVQMNGDDILLQGHLSANLVAECGRCLGDVPCPVEADVIALLSPDPNERHRSHSDEEVELTEEDTYRAHYSGLQVVLDDLVREHLILEVPMQPLCGPNCPGIAVPDHVRPPPEIFEKPPVDPRLAPLMKFKDKVPPKKE